MTQDTALNVLKTGGNVFLTGEPGAGKTYVVNEYVAWLETCGIKVAVAATTGIAATHIGGMTIHSWSGLGMRDKLSPYDLDQIASREVVAKRIRKAQVLIIDEVSMLDGNLLDMVDAVTRSIRQRSESFGGLQVVFVGDFYQLPPITRGGEAVRYAFTSKAWAEARPLTCYLTEQHRQEDEMFLGLLSSIRRGEIEEDHFTLLKEQTDIGFENVEPTRLFTHNADVDSLNLERLKQLSGEVRTFQMSAKGNKTVLAGLVKSCLSPEALTLKIDAMVMCTKNNFEAGYVNGTLGRVVAFDIDEGFPVIETADGRQITVRPTAWSVAEDKKVLAEVTQVPLRLAWAITVHKSQGMSLDAAEIDLSRAFVYGQGYVALSRVRTLQGLMMRGMNPYALQVDPQVIKADERFRIQANELDSQFSAMDEDEVVGMHQQFVTASGGTYHSEAKAAVVKSIAPKVSTTTETLTMLKTGKTIREIAKGRSMNESTIWSHLEKLQEGSELTKADVSHLCAAPTWERSYMELEAAMQKHTDEKLKPIFEATNERYDYDTIRLARLLYRLQRGK